MKYLISKKSNEQLLREFDMLQSHVDGYIISESGLRVKTTKNPSYMKNWRELIKNELLSREKEKSDMTRKVMVLSKETNEELSQTDFDSLLKELEKIIRKYNIEDNKKGLIKHR